MKYFHHLTAVLLVLLTACGGGPEASSNEIPEDLEGKRALLREKRAELKTLSDLVAQLEDEIAALDPSLQNKEGRLVTTATVSRRDFQHFVEIQGSVQADDMVDAMPEVSGRIIRLTVKEGDNVRRGQLIAELDLDQLQRQIAEVETSLELATTVYERQARLWEKNIGSEIQYLEAKNNKERLEKNLETMRNQLTKSKVYAPISGVVERVIVHNGELAAPGAPIVQILNTDKLKIVADVPETYLQAVKRGEPVKIRFPALGADRTERVTLVGRTIDPANRTFTLEANLSGGVSVLKPNLLAIVLLNDSTEPNAIVVPLTTIQQEVSGKKFVFVKGDGSEGPVARKVYVETGRSYEGDIVITNGLKGGEELILEGARGLAENDLIKVVEPKTEANNG